jgi:hypothetical protein
MTYEKGLFAQADPGIVSGSTIERKQMSTKTSFKRVALVAVTALGMGVLTSVAPANAAALTSATTAQSRTILTGVSSTVASVVFAGFVDSTADTVAVSAPTGPTGGTITFANVGGAVSVAGGLAGTNVITVGTAGTLTEASDSFGLAAAAATAKTVTATVSRPGTYTFTLGGSSTITLVARSLAYTTGDVAAATPFDTGSGIAGPANTVTVTAHSTQVADVRALVTVEGAGATIASATAGSGTSVIAANFLSARIPAATNAPVVINTPTAGTVTVKIFNETAALSGIYSPTAAETVTITVAAAAIAGVYAASTVYMNSSTTTPTSTSDATTAATAPTAAATASNTPVANILVSQVDAQATPANVATAATKAIVYEIAGAGALGTSNNQRLGSYIAVAAASANDNNVFIFPDGRSGVGTVTVKVNGVLVSTKKVNFYGSVASYTATVEKKHIANSGSPTADVLKVTAKDANGVVVPSATIFASAGTSTIGSVASSATTDATGVASFAATGLSAKFGTFTVTFLNAATAATATVTTTAVVGVSSVLAKTVTAKSDKATYAPGEKITWTMTFLDANGLGLPDGSYAADALLKNLASNPVASASLASTPFLGTAAVVLVAGVATATGYAPLNSGPVSYTWTIAGTAGAADTTNLVSALQATTVTASATVGANTDISAITTLINSLIAKINALNKLVIKIQKKVRA